MPRLTVRVTRTAETSRNVQETVSSASSHHRDLARASLHQIRRHRNRPETPTRVHTDVFRCAPSSASKSIPSARSGGWGRSGGLWRFRLKFGSVFGGFLGEHFDKVYGASLEASYQREKKKSVFLGGGPVEGAHRFQ